MTTKRPSLREEDHPSPQLTLPSLESNSKRRAKRERLELDLTMIARARQLAQDAIDVAQAPEVEDDGKAPF